MLRIVPNTARRVGRSYEHFPGEFELHLLYCVRKDGVLNRPLSCRGTSPINKETLGQSYGPRHRPPAGSWGGAVSYERGIHDGLHHYRLEGTSLMQSFTPPSTGVPRN